MREVVRGDKHNLRKSANCKAQISTTICGVNDTDLCVAICRFSQVVFVTSNNFTHNLLFYFQSFLVLMLISCGLSVWLLTLKKCFFFFFGGGGVAEGDYWPLFLLIPGHLVAATPLEMVSSPATTCDWYLNKNGSEKPRRFGKRRVDLGSVW